MSDLIPIDLDKNLPSQLFADGGLEPVLARIESEARSIVADVDTPKGRKAIASVAAKVASSKVYLDTLGKDYVADIKARAAKVDEQRRMLRDRLDKLKEDVRQPLTEYENEIRRRAEMIERTIADLSQDPGATIDEARARLAYLQSFSVFADTYGDRVSDVHMARDAGIARAMRRIDELEAERERAEAERKRIETERVERERRIAEEAAAKARRDAEAAAEKARIEVERKATEQAEMAKRQLAEAERRIKEAEQRAIAQAAAEKQRIENAERRAMEEAQRKAEALRNAEIKEQMRLAKQKEVRARVGGDITEYFVGACGFSAADAKKAAIAIMNGKCPHVSIRYPEAI